MAHCAGVGVGGSQVGLPGSPLFLRWEQVGSGPGALFTEERRHGQQGWSSQGQSGLAPMQTAAQGWGWRARDWGRGRELLISRHFGRTFHPVMPITA